MVYRRLFCIFVILILISIILGLCDFCEIQQYVLKIIRKSIKSKFLQAVESYVL